MSYTAGAVALKFVDNKSYIFDNINFKHADVVIDVGSNIGMISIYLAKNIFF
jgi:tRNA1(Val) A37 N6-methylase TrmN6